MNCINCGCTLNSDDVFCGSCGTENTILPPAHTFCGHCGSKNENDADFCGQCGTRFDKEQKQEQEPYEQAPQMSDGFLPADRVENLTYVPEPTVYPQAAPKTSNNSTIIAIVAACVALIVVTAVVFLLFSNNEGEEQLDGGLFGLGLEDLMESDLYEPVPEPMPELPPPPPPPSLPEPSPPSPEPLPEEPPPEEPQPEEPQPVYDIAELLLTDQVLHYVNGRIIVEWHSPRQGQVTVFVFHNAGTPDEWWYMYGRAGDSREVHPSFAVDGDIVYIGFPTTASIYTIYTDGSGIFEDNWMTWHVVPD